MRVMPGGVTVPQRRGDALSGVTPPQAEGVGVAPVCDDGLSCGVWPSDVDERRRRRVGCST
jgi:hypothetical protein